MRERLILIFVLCAFSVFIPILNVGLAHATVDISEIPQRLADGLTMPLIAGQMLVSTGILCLTLFPTMLLTKNTESQSLAVIIMTFCTMGFLIGAGWLPYWFLIVTVFIVALLFSSQVRGYLTGR